MKNLFSWRLPLSDAEFSYLWENATFVFDANFLLDLYRVSQPTAQDILKTLKKIADRIWLPYQVAEEFLKRREAIIIAEAESFEKALSIITQWKSEQNKFNSLRSQLQQAGRIVAAEVEYLFDNQKNYFDAINEVEQEFREKISELARTHCSLEVDNDNILEEILLIFDSKVGKPYDEESLQKLHIEADKRYKKLQPPGFKDAEKKDEQKYGDFILWKQLLDFAKEKSLPIIFVTGEKKEDWWIKNKGEIVSPRIELRHEFQEYVGQLFWMYRTQRFLEKVKEEFKIDINQKSIEETNIIAIYNSPLEEIIEELQPLTTTHNSQLEEIAKELQPFTTYNSQLEEIAKKIRQIYET